MDNFFKDMFRKREAAPASGTVTTTNPAATDNQQRVASYEEKMVRVSSPGMSLTVSAVYRAIELKAKTIGQMQMQYQRLSSAGGNFVPSMYGDARYLNYLIQKRPNPMMTASELFQQMSIHRELYGNAFVYIERDRKQNPINLWVASCGGYDPLTETYTLTYNSDHGMVSRFEAPARDVIHWRNTYRHLEGYMGIPTHAYALQTLSLIATERQQALETAAKGGRVKILVQEKDSAPQGARGRANQSELKKITKQLDSELYGSDAIFMNNVADTKQIQFSAQDQQLIEQMNLGLDDVARFYATPRPLLMLDTNSKYNDYTNATMEYLQRTIAPLARELEDLFDTKFLNMEDFGQRRFHLCELPLLRMDLEKQAKVDQMHLQMGWTVNEIRAQYDLPSVKDGDKVYISTNVAELGSEKLSGAVATGRPSNEPVNP